MAEKEQKKLASETFKSHFVENIQHAIMLFFEVLYSGHQKGENTSFKIFTTINKTNHLALRKISELASDNSQ